MQVLTFSLNDEQCAVDTGIVDTIENISLITFVPKARKYVRGLINFRGYALPVIDIKMIFDLQNDSGKPDQKLIIINHKNQKMALSVTDVNEVIDIEEGEDTTLLNLEMSILNFNGNIFTYLSEEILSKI